MLNTLSQGIKYMSKRTFYIYDNTKTFRLIKQCDLRVQLYEGVALSSNSESQTIFFIFYVCQN